MKESMASDSLIRKALDSESRMHILRSLIRRRKTQSELAKELSLASPTILQHLSILLDAGLIYKIDEGRKWKYYALTEKGRKLMGVKENPIPIRSIVLFAFALILISSSLYMLFFNMPPQVQRKEAPSDVRLVAFPQSQLEEQPAEDYTIVYYLLIVIGIISLILAIYIYLKEKKN